MELKEYTWIMSTYKPTILGQVEDQFLDEIKNYSKTSAYQLFATLRTIEEMRGNEKKGMSYKNVHKRVKRLHELGLIEEIEGRFERGAKYYRITTYGIMTLLATNHFLKKDDIIRFQDDIIIKSLIFQFFEESTIKSMTNDLELKINDLLQSCCIVTRQICFQYQMFIKNHELKDIEFPEDNIIQKYNSYLDGEKVENNIIEVMKQYKDKFKQYINSSSIKDIFLNPENFIEKNKHMEITSIGEVGLFGVKEHAYKIINLSDLDFPQKILRKKLAWQIREFAYKILTLISININEIENYDNIEAELKREEEYVHKYYFQYRIHELDDEKSSKLLSEINLERPKYYYRYYIDDLSDDEIEDLEDKFDKYSFVLISKDKKFRKLLENVKFDIEQAKEILLL